MSSPARSWAERSGARRGGHFCAATQILILADGWDQTAQLLDDLRGFLRTLEPRTPYYPGTDARVAS